MKVFVELVARIQRGSADRIPPISIKLDARPVFNRLGVCRGWFVHRALTWQYDDGLCGERRDAITRRIINIHRAGFAWPEASNNRKTPLGLRRVRLSDRQTGGPARN